MTLLPRLYAIADAAFGDPVILARELFRGGATLVQVRHKQAPSGQLLEVARRIVAEAPPNARVIVNDRADVALLGGAAGVHLGQDDLDAAAARQLLGTGAIIGLSTHSLDQALAADNLPVDYIAVGPIFATTTKPDASPVLGTSGLARICRRVRKPVVAIGGITLDNAGSVLEAGAAAVAVISGILGASDVAGRAREFLDRLESESGV